MKKMMEAEAAMKKEVEKVAEEDGNTFIASTKYSGSKPGMIFQKARNCFSF